MSRADGHRIADLIDRLYHGANRRVVEELAARGFGEIRVSHAAVFETIGEGSRVTDMAERVGMTKQSMGELVSHLETHGYVERTPDPSDRRARLVRVTRRGRAAADAAREVIEEMVETWWRDLGDEGLRRARRSLERLSEGITPTK